ncbi:uncharacterized protein PV07_12417 [Cladophialophora immunda]|uniref:Uncharacterized protein n=1 Tax=Cladophialophora immunda TaxID=569365 RepID=A0A0D2CGB1_9EURO|nr:uncharacterized protein PV07_12417 [Cladophialophora immunda]KIW22539.1 hypothetical protein PV07_12417 [Cladophialophora immunda]OQV10108.1 hypothetical protein CLAIMM_14152 [Cladophialophora immunda]
MFSDSVLYVYLLIGRVWGLPIGGSVDSSYDAWATALSDVGPLILLIGERSTKQLLRDIRGISGAFSLAAAPLGLVSIVTSLFRMSGSHRIRSFLGYEQESRSVAALEMSRVNCNGIHPELVDGYLVRTTAATSAFHARAVGVSILQSTISEDTIRDVTIQLQSCHTYEAAKIRLHVPTTAARLRWCSQILVADQEKNDIKDRLLEILAAALQVNLLDQKSETLRGWLQHTLNLPTANMPPQHNKSAASMRVAVSGAGKISFAITFDAVSEYSTANLTSRKMSSLIGLSSTLTILAFYLIELRFSLVWRLSTGWILTIIGYIGIVTFVTLAARNIYHSSHSIPLRPRHAPLSQTWKDGLVIAAQSDSKVGAEFLTAVNGGRQAFEAVWLKPLTSWDCIKADAIGICLTMSFLCHYLGLRSSSWWLGVCELVICIAAAFARSLTKSRPVQFRAGTGQYGEARVDWRCCSTGLITVQNATEVDTRPQAVVRCLDLRIYSPDMTISTPIPAESIAWHAAALCSKDQHLLRWILNVTDMKLWVGRSEQGGASHAVVIYFTSGILVQEGLASTDVGMCVAFCCTMNGLAAPTAWLVRAIMRQPRWSVDRKAFTSINDTIGKVHVPSLSSIMTWWSMSELRNGPTENQENLQWAFLLLNTAYFSLLQSGFGSSAADTNNSIIDSLRKLHRETNPGCEAAAVVLFERMKSEQQRGAAVVPLPAISI